MQSDLTSKVKAIHRALSRNLADLENIRRGEALFVEKKLYLGPFSGVILIDWNDWEQDPFNNRTWQWRLNWLSFLSYLIAFHNTNPDDKVLDFACDAIMSWLDKYLEVDVSFPFEFIWHDHGSALRAEQLVIFICYCRERAPTWASKHAGFLARIECALIVHAQLLAMDSFYSQHTNHGLEQSRVLLMLGSVFSTEKSKEWQDIALRRIGWELDFSFTEEGVHVENSPGYHIFVFKAFIGIISDYPEDMLGGLADIFFDLSAKALGFIAYILRPDAKLPPIGDTEQLPTSDAYKDMLEKRIEYHNFLYAFTQGKQGVAPRRVNRVYPQSGYAIFRDAWHARDSYEDSFHLVVKAGCLSRYHHQQDEGHIVLYAGGEDWLIDSGLYNYNNSDPVRRYVRSRLGHNVAIVSHSSYAKDFDHRLGAWQVIEYSEHHQMPFVAIRMEVLLPVIQERRVSFNGEAKIVEVNDRLSAGDGIARRFTLQWHFPSDKTLAICDNKVLIRSQRGSRLAVEFEGDKLDGMSVLKGRSENRIYSCVSYKLNEASSSQVLLVKFNERLGLDVTTRFIFEDVN